MEWFVAVLDVLECKIFCVGQPWCPTFEGRGERKGEAERGEGKEGDGGKWEGKEVDGRGGEKRGGEKRGGEEMGRG